MLRISIIVINSTRRNSVQAPLTRRLRLLHLSTTNTSKNTPPYQTEPANTNFQNIATHREAKLPQHNLSASPTNPPQGSKKHHTLTPTIKCHHHHSSCPAAPTSHSYAASTFLLPSPRRCRPKMVAYWPSCSSELHLAWEICCPEGRSNSFRNLTSMQQSEERQQRLGAGGRRK